MLEFSMPFLSSIENLKDKTELVICDSSAAMEAHKELFRSSDDSYMVADGDNMFDFIAGIIRACNLLPSPCLHKIHIVLGWKNLLQVSLWQPAKPDTGDAFMLLKNSGLDAHELQPFKTSDINDIFPWLYYGKRFDVLRKICHTAKKKIEGSFKNNGNLVHASCHIISEDAKRIVASSL